MGTIPKVVRRMLLILTSRGIFFRGKVLEFRRWLSWYRNDQRQAFLADVLQAAQGESAGSEH